jgi:hypothetical protein
MSIRLGTTNPSALRLGTTAVSKLMLGATEIWSAVDADAQAYFDRITAAGSTISNTNKAAVNAFIVGCKADGIWTAIKAACFLAGPDNLTGALVPLVGTAPTNFSFSSGDHSRTTGLLSNGAKYINSNRANNADPQNNFSMGFWQTNAASMLGAIMGAGGANPGASMIATDQTVRCRNTSAFGGGLSVGNGYGGINRSSSSGYSSRFNGSTLSWTQSSQTPLGNTILIYRTAIAGVPTNPRLAFYHIGESLNLALLDARLATYMSSIA